MDSKTSLSILRHRFELWPVELKISRLTRDTLTKNRIFLDVPLIRHYVMSTKVTVRNGNWHAFLTYFGLFQEKEHLYCHIPIKDTSQLSDVCLWWRRLWFLFLVLCLRRARLPISRIEGFLFSGHWSRSGGLFGWIF